MLAFPCQDGQPAAMQCTCGLTDLRPTAARFLSERSSSRMETTMANPQSIMDPGKCQSHDMGQCRREKATHLDWPDVGHQTEKCPSARSPGSRPGSIAPTGCWWVIEAVDVSVSKLAPNRHGLNFLLRRTHIADWESCVPTEVLCRIH